LVDPRQRVTLSFETHRGQNAAHAAEHWMVELFNAPHLFARARVKHSPSATTVALLFDPKSRRRHGLHAAVTSPRTWLAIGCHNLDGTT
jgi:hypothetical protein